MFLSVVVVEAGRLKRRTMATLRAVRENGHIDVVRYLHANGVELNAPDNEPLCRAAASGPFGTRSATFIRTGVDISDSRQRGRCVCAGVPAEASTVSAVSARGRALHASCLRSRLVTSIERMKQELLALRQPCIQPSAVLEEPSVTSTTGYSAWSGEANFKRTLNQNYFNFIPTSHDDARMLRVRRLTRGFDKSALATV